MKQVVHEAKSIDREKRLPVLKLEIDYELVTLHDAIEQEDIDLIKQTKRKLQVLSQELNHFN